MGLGAPWAFSACSSWPRRRPAYGQEERASSRRGDPCLPALAAAGNDLIVEHIIEFRAWREYLATLLGGLDVFLVGVHCDLAEIDRRERDRGDRRIGEDRSHVETDLIHTFGPYDFEVDTTNAVLARSPQLYRPPGEPGPAGEPCGRAYLVTGNLNPYLSRPALLAPYRVK